MRRFLALLLTAAVLWSMAACGGAGAETAKDDAPAAPAAVPKTSDAYPRKEISMIIPYGAGGTTDLVGRRFAAALEKQLGQAVVIQNIGGASGSIGAKAALDAAPDGYTVLFTADSLGTQRVMGISQMSYDDFSPIAVVANDPKVIVVAKGSPYETIGDLLDDIQAHPDRIQMSYTGPGGSGHVQALIMNRFGYSPALTAYAGGSDCLAALLGGQVAFTNSNYSTVTAYLESGDLKALAVCSTQPLPGLPDVPTLASVIPGSDELMDIPYTPLSLLVDRDVPEEVRETLSAAAKAALQDGELNRWLEENCIDKLYEKYTTPEEMRSFFDRWESTVSWLLYDAGATVNSPEDFGIPRP